MATVRSTKAQVKSVPGPGRTSFALGTRPPSLRAPAPGTMTIKPQPGSTTQYGKQPKTNPGFGNTGLTGET